MSAAIIEAGGCGAAGRPAQVIEWPAAPNPLLVELFAQLPPPDTEWPAEKRAQWLRAAIEIIALIYGGTPNQLVVTAAKDATQ